MLLHHLVTISGSLAATRSRLLKRDLLVDALTRAADSGDLEVVARYLAGELRQRRTGLGWRSLAEAPVAAAEPTLRVAEIDHALEHISALAGPGSQTRRGELVSALMSRATAAEQRYLRDLITGTLRQGALDAAMTEAIAAAFEVDIELVRRAVMLTGSTPEVAQLAATGGEAGVAAVRLEVGRAVRPMLASSAPEVAVAWEMITGTGTDANADDDAGAAVGSDPDPVVVDGKLDGIRVQVHRDGEVVRVFTRSLDDITTRLPEVVEGALAMPARCFILDGEALALDAQDQRPLPFQVSAARTASRTDVDAHRAVTPLTALYFDLVHLDGVDLLDEPAHVRFAALADLVGEHLVPRIETDDPLRASRYADELVAGGHEGVVVKDRQSAYTAGRRGAGWVKVKPRHTLDLVVLGVEWGSGRRTGMLSNIHLGARDPATEGFVMVGKTFKGMTDEMLAWQTSRFLQLERDRSAHVVWVRPEQVVEVAVDGAQSSSRYPGGVALRFARVVRYRDDKSACEVDTIDTVRGLRPG